MTPQDCLDFFRTETPKLLIEAPKDAKGLYALVSHEDRVRYIGETKNDTFYKRIANRHVTGSEGNSHKFSCEYNVGRMWRGDQKAPGFVQEDARAAKKLRTSFIHRYCRALWIPVSGTSEEIRALEQEVIGIALSGMVLWNGGRSRRSSFEEPQLLVDQLINDLGVDRATLEALARQERRYSMGCCRACQMGQ